MHNLFQLKKGIQQGWKQREINKIRKQYIEEKGYTVVKMCECEWWKLYETDMLVKGHWKQSFSHKLPLSHDQ